MDIAERLRILADLEPILAAGETEFGHWEVTAATGDVHHLPWFCSGPGAEAFTRAVGRGDWMMMGFDWGNWLQSPEGQALRDTPDVLAAATADQLAMLLTAIVRSDRFIEGSIAGAFESGLLLRIARRAGALLADTT